MLCSNVVPVIGEEEHVLRRDQLLERPAALEPQAAREVVVPILIVFLGRNVPEVRVAQVRAPVPLVHGVDRLGQLRAARLVDAARIDPDVLEAVSPRHLACPSDLLVEARKHFGVRLRIALNLQDLLVRLLRNVAALIVLLRPDM